MFVFLYRLCMFPLCLVSSIILKPIDLNKDVHIIAHSGRKYNLIVTVFLARTYFYRNGMEQGTSSDNLFILLKYQNISNEGILTGLTLYTCPQY